MPQRQPHRLHARGAALLAVLALAGAAQLPYAAEAQLVRLYKTSEAADWFTDVADNVFAWPALGSACVNGNNVATFAGLSVFDQATNGFSDITWTAPFVAGTGATTTTSTSYCAASGVSGKTTGYSI